MNYSDDDIGEMLLNEYISESQLNEIAAMGPRALACACRILQGPRSIEQLNGAGTLMTLIGSPAVGPLITMIRNGQIAKFLCGRLVGIDDPRVVPFLLEMLRSDDPDSNEWAAMGLGDLRSSEAVPVLIDKLASDKADVLFSVISALGEIRDPRAIGPLKDLQARTRAGIFELRDLAATIRDIERVNSM